MPVNCLGFHQSEPQENATRFPRQAALAVELARSLVMLADNEKDCLSRDAGSSGCGCHCTTGRNHAVHASMQGELLRTHFACLVSLIFNLTVTFLSLLHR
jgi:hypothetical protein